MPSRTEPDGRSGGQAGAQGLFAAGALLVGLAVAAGAFGAHALEARVPGDLLATFETGAHYHLTQSLGVLALALAADRWALPALRTAGWMVVLGTLVFSGSLYVLVLSGARWLGAVTPVGGVLLIAGWLTAAATVIRGGRMLRWSAD